MSEPHDLNIRWHIGFQNKEDDLKGIEKVNELIDLIPVDPSNWVCFAADHTWIHQSFFRRLGELIRENPSKRGIIVSGERRDPNYRILHAQPKNIVPGKVCGSQCVYRRDLIGDERFNWDRYQSGCDGELAKSLFERNRNDFLLVDEVLTSYQGVFWTRSGDIRGV